MYLIKFKEFGFELLGVQELFYIKDRHQAIIVASELNEFIQDIVEKCKEQGILGCVRIPELDIFISSISSICSVEAVEIKPFEPIKDLTFEHLLA